MRKLKSVVTGGMVAATIVGALGAGAAYAKPIINTTSGLSCQVKIDNNLSIAYPPGTTMTVTMSDGTKETYTCDGNTGNWVKTSRVLTNATRLPHAAQLVNVAAR
jgi:hypothetical protein